jgi:hypothetical protein
VGMGDSTAADDGDAIHLNDSFGEWQ